MLIDEYDVFDNAIEVASFPICEHNDIENSDILEFQTVVNIYNSGNNYYQHSQATPASSWTFDHDLGRPVTAALVEDSGGNDWACNIINNSISNVTLHIGQIMGGSAKVI